jgi:hypothetical protein
MVDDDLFGSLRSALGCPNLTGRPQSSTPATPCIFLELYIQSTVPFNLEKLFAFVCLQQLRTSKKFHLR